MSEPKEGILTCTSLLKIIKPFVSVGPHLQIKTPQTNAGISSALRTHAFCYILIRVNFTRRSQKIHTMPADRWVSRMPGPHPLLTLENITAIPLCECLFDVLKRDKSLFVSLAKQTAFTLVRPQNPLSNKDL